MALVWVDLLGFGFWLVGFYWLAGWVFACLVDMLGC